jgi:hypothetical protein
MTDVDLSRRILAAFVGCEVHASKYANVAVLSVDTVDGPMRLALGEAQALALRDVASSAWVKLLDIRVEAERLRPGNLCRCERCELERRDGRDELSPSWKFCCGCGHGYIFVGTMDEGGCHKCGLFCHWRETKPSANELIAPSQKSRKARRKVNP